MNDGKINLSELQILARLAEMEKYLPMCTKKSYFPSVDYFVNFSEHLVETLQNEADCMLDFVGFGMYTSKVHVEKLAGAAGNIHLLPNMVADITLDSETVLDKNAVLATLAHEICHRLLYSKKLWFSAPLDEMENEIFADLATFYVGFGDLTLNGFVTVRGNFRIRSGYLTSDTYYRAYVIMRAMSNNLQFNIDRLPDFVRNGIEKAQRESKLYCYSNLTKYFEEASKNLASERKCLDFCVQVLDFYKNINQEYCKDLNDSFFIDEYSDFRKIRMAYSLAKLGDKYQSTEYMIMNKIKQRIIKSLDLLLDRDVCTVDIHDIEIKRFCPICGQLINKVLDNRTYHFICPNCKSHILIDNDFADLYKKISCERNTRARHKTSIEEYPKLLEINDNYASMLESLKTENEKIKRNRLYRIFHFFKFI